MVEKKGNQLEKNSVNKTEHAWTLQASPLAQVGRGPDAADWLGSSGSWDYDDVWWCSDTNTLAQIILSFFKESIVSILGYTIP